MTKEKKKILGIIPSRPMHWVGNGFPMTPMFSFSQLGEHISPFLTLGWAKGYHFEPTAERRGVGMHPHRGFETVTIVYDGQVEHHDTSGVGGVIGPGDVQWMTAGQGILHDEFHASSFAQSGGTLSMVQLWVNLPAKDKMAPGAYQALLNADIPTLVLGDGAGAMRVIAGQFSGLKGPARTFSPLNVWDMNLNGGKSAIFSVPEGHTTLISVLNGTAQINDVDVREMQTVLFDLAGRAIEITAGEDSLLLIMTGEPLGEPIVGYGPFVMNTEAQIREAIDDFNAGKFLSS